MDTILANILSADHRAQAEEQLNECLKDLNTAASHLIQCLSHGDEHIRNLAAVTLHRFVIKIVSEGEGPFMQLNPDVRQHVVSAVLQQIQQEPSRSAARALSKCIVNMVDAQGEDFMNNVLNLLLQMSNGNEVQRVTALELFGDLKSVIAEMLTNLLGTIKSVFQNNMSHESLNVRVSACYALSMLVSEFDNKSINQFADLIPAMADTLQQSVTVDDEKAKDIISNLCDIKQMKFFKPYCEQFCGLLINFIKNKDITEKIRHLSFELFTLIAENASAMIRKFPALMGESLNCCFQCMSEFESEYETVEEFLELEEDDYNMNTHEVGEQMLYRLALVYGGKRVVPIIFPTVIDLCKSADWPNQYIGVTAISSLGEACQEQFAPQLNTLVDGVVSLANNGDMRVKYAAMRCLQSLSEDYNPQLQNDLHSVILPSIVYCLQSGAEKVVCQATVTLELYLSEMEESNMKLYTSQLMEILVNLLGQSQLKTQSQILSVISSIAQITRAEFAAYYDQMMAMLINVLHTGDPAEQNKLICKAVECVGLLSQAVGKDKFGPHAERVMTLLLGIMETVKDIAEDQVRPYALSAIGDICTCLGEGFLPFLPAVAELLKQYCVYQIECTEIGANEVPDSDGFELFSVPAAGGKVYETISISSTDIEIKSVAIDLASTVAETLLEHFCPIAQTIYEDIKKLLSFAYNDEVRIDAIRFMNCALTCFVRAAELNDQFSQAPSAFFTAVLPDIAKAMKLERDADVQYTQIEILTLMLEKAGLETLSNPMILTVLQELLEHLFTDHLERREAVGKLRNDEDFDEETAEEVEGHEENERDMLSVIMEFFGEIFSVVGSAALPMLVHFKSIIDQYIQPGNNPSDVNSVSSLLCAAFLHCGEEMAPYAGDYCKAAMHYSGHDDQMVRQTTSYMLGLIAVNVPGAPVQEIMATLGQRISDPKNSEKDYVICRDNCIASLARIIFAPHLQMDQATLIPQLLSQLPLQQDTVEQSAVCEMLLTNLSNNNTHLLGPNYAHLPQILSIFGQSVRNQMISEECMKGLVGYLAQLRHSSAQMLEAVLGQLSQEDRTALTSLPQN
eukprot:GCRY01000518.1.p1 GENE.GCRY01000518.1~~GCRY01000518.1.p1  ORF type:complete len:1147 (+),score=376.11 GCRY01000518.1:208-3441(+)